MFHWLILNLSIDSWLSVVDLNTDLLNHMKVDYCDIELIFLISNQLIHGLLIG